MTEQENEPIYYPITVTRAVQTRSGDTYCLVTKGEQAHWISQTKMVTNKQEVLSELASAGIPLIKTKTITDLADQLENHPAPTPALVASQPGWLANEVYVHPNGEVQKGENVSEEIIVAFIPDLAYGTSGSLEEWRTTIEPYLANQPLMRFGLCYAFSALMLAKVKPNPFNQIVEVFGDKEAGKSVIGAAFGSVVGGDLETGVGIGRTANSTSSGFKQVQRMANDTLLFLDETNILDKNVEGNLRFFFDHTSRDERIRYGASKRPQPIRNALLITGNERLSDRAKASSPIAIAAQSRCLSINVGTTVVHGLKQTEDEKRNWFIGLINASDNYYGTAGRAFIQMLIAESAKDADALSGKISRRQKQFLSKMRPSPHLSERIRATISLAYVAGTLAYEWGIWPSSKKVFLSSCERVFTDANSQATVDATLQSGAVKRLTSALVDNFQHIARITQKTKKAIWKVGHPPLGYRWQHDDETQCFFFETATFRSLLGAKSLADVKELKRLGFLKGEQGRNPRSDSKPPSHVPLEGRGYEIALPTKFLELIRSQRT